MKEVKGREILGFGERLGRIVGDKWREERERERKKEGERLQRRPCNDRVDDVPAGIFVLLLLSSVGDNVTIGVV